MLRCVFAVCRATGKFSLSLSPSLVVCIHVWDFDRNGHVVLFISFSFAKVQFIGRMKMYGRAIDNPRKQKTKTKDEESDTHFFPPFDLDEMMKKYKLLKISPFCIVFHLSMNVISFLFIACSGSCSNHSTNQEQANVEIKLVKIYEYIIGLIIWLITLSFLSKIFFASSSISECSALCMLDQLLCRFQCVKFCIFFVLSETIFWQFQEALWFHSEVCSSFFFFLIFTCRIITFSHTDTCT